jgi:hypothetical protein
MRLSKYDRIGCPQTSSRFMLGSNRHLHKNTLAIMEGIGQIGAVARIAVNVLTVVMPATTEAGDRTVVVAAAGATTN